MKRRNARWRPLLRCRRGTTAVEFALAAPAFLYFLFGTLDTGWLFASQMTLDWATAAGARYAAVNSSTASSTSIATLIRNDAGALIPNCATACQVSVSYSPSNKVGAVLTITTTLNWSPLSGLTLLQSQQLSATTQISVLN